MAQVYAARDLNGDREVAIKLASSQYLAGAEEALLREARLLSGFSHPQIVSIYDWGKSPAGRPYYAMELVRGVTLREWVRSRGPLPVRTVAAVVARLCEALGVVHDLGIVHHDVTPANVMVMDEGAELRLKLIDFGVAQRARPQGRPPRVVGTPGYMAPEVVRGEAFDHRADLYSVGSIAHFLFTGESLGGTTTTRTADEWWGPGDQPPAADWVRRCLSHDPRERPATAADLLRRVQVAACGSGFFAVTRPREPATVPPPAR